MQKSVAKPPIVQRQKCRDRVFDEIEDRLFYAAVSFDMSDDDWLELCKLVLPERYETPPIPPQPMALPQGESHDERVRVMQLRYQASVALYHPADVIPSPVRRQNEYEPRLRQSRIEDYEDDE
jgi:hypothetical protein